MILLKKAMKKTNQYRTRGSAILFCISLSFSRFHEDGSMSPSSCFCSKDSSYGAPCLWYCSRIWERNLWINQNTNQLSVLIYFYQWRAQFPMNYLKRLFALCQSLLWMFILCYFNQFLKIETFEIFTTKFSHLYPFWKSIFKLRFNINIGIIFHQVINKLITSFQLQLSPLMDSIRN